MLTLGRYGPTPIRVEAWPEAPVDPIDDHWEHVVEVSFATDGLVRVVSWPDEGALEVPVPPGAVRARVHWGGLTEEADRMASAADDPADGDDEDEVRRGPVSRRPRWPPRVRPHTSLY